MKVYKALLAAGLLLPAFGVQAATLCVSPAGGACFTDIQTAVDTAVPGDIIKIAPFTYEENVTVATAGLTLMGASAKTTIIDTGLFGGDPLVVTASSVSVIGLGFRNSPSFGVNVTADNFRLSKSEATTNASDDCVAITGNNAVIELSRFVACADQGLDISGDNARILSNKFLTTGEGGLEVTGDNALVEKNNCESIEDENCIDVAGDNAIVRSNIALNSDDDTILVTGDNALIQSNRLTANQDGGIAAAGASPKVLSNRVAGVLGANEGIEVDCTTDCSAAQVISNTVLSVVNGGDCYALTFDAAGGRVLTNSASNCAGTGFALDGTATLTVTGNRATNGGNAGEPGFAVLDTGNKSLTSNTARGFGDGFFVDDAGHFLQKNTATGNNLNGMFLEATSVSTQVIQNNVSGNIGEGIQNEGDMNNFIGNIVKGNRSGSDFCESGTNTVQATPAQIQALNTIGSPVTTTCIP